jgi:hypothetical protein
MTSIARVGFVGSGGPQAQDAVPNGRYVKTGGRQGTAVSYGGVVGRRGMLRLDQRQG